MRIGVALPTAINIPFTMIGAAGLRTDANGNGDIALKLAADDRMAWSNFWPHVRPWHLSKPEPMLRCIPDVQAVAGLLADALAQQSPEGTVRTAPVRQNTGRAKSRHPVTAAA